MSDKIYEVKVTLFIDIEHDEDIDSEAAALEAAKARLFDVPSRLTDFDIDYDVLVTEYE
jgi:hypothetical protein